jgi:hypothetical protein
LPGVQGVKGERGYQGDPGKDAPIVIQVRIRKDRNRIKFIFTYSDGSENETNYITLPDITTIIQQSVVASSSGGAGGELEFFNDGVSLGTFEKVDFLNGNVTPDPIDPTKLNVNLKTKLPILDEGVLVTEYPEEIDFVGANVQILPEQVIANWNTLDEVTDLATFGGNPNKVTVKIEGEAERLTKVFTAGESIAKLDLVRLTSSSQIFKSVNNVDYENANVIGIALNSGNTGNDIEVQLFGVVDDPLFTFTANEPLFLNSLSAPSETAPNTSGQFITEIGQGLGLGSIFINTVSPVEIL